MNLITPLTDNIVALLRARPALAKIAVEPVVWPTDIWAVIEEGIGIGVAVVKGDWIKKEREINGFVDQDAVLTVQIAIKTDSPKDNTDGLKGPGQLWDLHAEILEIRDSSIGVLGETGDLRLAASGFAIVPSKTRAEGGAGPLALVQTFDLEMPM